MPLRGTLSGVAPSPFVSRCVLPDAPRQHIRNLGAETGAGGLCPKLGPNAVFFMASRVML